MPACRNAVPPFGFNSPTNSNARSPRSLNSLTVSPGDTPTRLASAVSRTISSPAAIMRPAAISYSRT